MMGLPGGISAQAGLVLQLLLVLSHKPLRKDKEVSFRVLY